MNEIYIDPIEAVELSHLCRVNSRNFSEQISRIYSAKPKKSCEKEFFTFLDAIFNAGRVSGIRQERLRRKGAKQQG